MHQLKNVKGDESYHKIDEQLCRWFICFVNVFDFNIFLRKEGKEPP